MKRKPKNLSPLEQLVRELRGMGYGTSSQGMVLRAFKWKAHGDDGWIPPYNHHIWFRTKDALQTCGTPAFLSDMASGRFDGITDGSKQIFTGNENKKAKPHGKPNRFP